MIDSNILLITIQGSNKEDPKLLNFTWNTTSITSIDITIQLKFETPTSISPKVKLSKINCNFIGERQHLCQVYQSILLYLGLDKHACQSRN